MNSRRPHFLEVFLPNLSSDRLKVPVKFLKYMEGRTSGPVLLTGPSGNSWHVDLIEQNDHLYLHDGWSIFVKDHYIQCGDSLVFRYDGNLRFTVQIFDPSSCEKEEAFYAKCSQAPSDSNKNQGMKRNKEKEVASFMTIGEKKIRVSPVVLEAHAGSREQKVETRRNKGCEPETVAVNEKNQKSFESIVTKKFGTGSNESAIPATPALANAHTSENSCIAKRNPKTSLEKKCGLSTVIEKRVAQYFTSSFPYFVKVMRTSNVNEKGNLKLPVAFSKAYFPKRRMKVVLRNLKGDCWMINSTPVGNAHAFGGGWLAFVRENDIKMDAICIFELVGEFELRFRILRLGLEELYCRIENGGVRFATESDELMPDPATTMLQETEVSCPPGNSKGTNNTDKYDGRVIDHNTTELHEGQQEAAFSVDAYEDDTAEKSCVSSGLCHMSQVFNENKGLDFQSENGGCDGCIAGSLDILPESAENVSCRTNDTASSFESEHADEADISGDTPSKNTEKLPEVPELAASYIYLNGGDDVDSVMNTAVCPPAKSSNEVADDLPVYNSEGTMSDEASRKNQMASHTVPMQTTAEVPRAMPSFRSLYPNFMKVMGSSNVSGSYTLNVPRDFAFTRLPKYKAVVTLRNLKGQSWNVNFVPERGHTRFYGGWISFVRGNDIKVGDVCVFELVDEWVFLVRTFAAAHGELDCRRNDVMDNEWVDSVGCATDSSS